MAIRFYGKAGSQSGSCPSVSIDDDGSFLFVGWPVDDPDKIAEILTYKSHRSRRAGVPGAEGTT
jgi:hypothetical protein